MEQRVFESAIKLVVGDGIIENLSYVLNQKHCEKVMIVSDNMRPVVPACSVS